MDLDKILAQTMRGAQRQRDERWYARTDADRRARRAEFERRFAERLSSQTHSVRLALCDEPMDAMRFRHWFLYMRFTPLDGLSIEEWRRKIDLDILNKQELEGE